MDIDGRVHDGHRISAHRHNAVLNKEKRKENVYELNGVILYEVNGIVLYELYELNGIISFRFAKIFTYLTGEGGIFTPSG